MSDYIVRNNPELVDETIDQAVKFNSENNIELREKTKILGKNENSTEYEILGLNEYTVGSTTYDQVEVGSESVHLNLNTNNDPNSDIHVTVDTPNGKKTLAYTDDLPGIDIIRGTWTPELISTDTAPTFTYNSRYGYYYKIDKLVYISCYANITITDIGTGYALIAGLPYSGSSTVDSMGIPMMTASTILDTPCTGRITANSSNIEVRNSIGTSSLRWKSGTGYVGFSGVYLID